MSWERRYPPERLVPYDPTWVDRYSSVAANLARHLGPQWVTEHVGSTSVPGLPAKPVIDIALRLPAGHDPATWGPVFRDLGWTTPCALGDHHVVFLLDGGVRQMIGHVFTAEHWPTAHIRLFADWLRTHPRDRDEYARLKTEIVASGVWGSEYTSAKATFVLKIVNRARAARGMAQLSHLPA